MHKLYFPNNSLLEKSLVSVLQCQQPPYIPFDALNYDQNRQLGAVLLYVFLKNNEMYVMLTKRSAHMPSHASQVAMPGGRIKGDDELANPLLCALRESYEEVGIVNPHVLGKLPNFRTNSGYSIIPYVSLGHQDFKPVLDEKEVVGVINFNLNYLTEGKNLIKHTMYTSNSQMNSIGIVVENNYIWGATALIMLYLYYKLKYIYTTIH